MKDPDLFAPIVAPPLRAEGFVLCEFSGVTLAIAQSDVLTIEHGSELAAPLPGEAQLGWFDSAQGPWPVFALDRELRLLDRMPGNHAFLAFLKHAAMPVGLLCEGIKIVGNKQDLRIEPLPPVMRDERQPLAAIARLDSSRLAWITAEGALVTHLLSLSEPCAAEVLP